MTIVQRRIGLGLVAGLVLLVLIRTFVFGVYTVPTVSMAPTLIRGDWILVDRLATRGNSVARGDVIVFRSGGEEHVKRVIGLPGESIEFQAGEVVINGAALRSTPVREVTLSAEGAAAERPRGITTHVLFEETTGVRTWRALQFRQEKLSAGSFKVPEGKLFVLGDNRSDSEDSRSTALGFVPLEAVQGRVTHVLCSTASTGNYTWFHRID